MIGCKACPWSCPDFVRNAQGQQRSGWRLLMAHWSQAHGTLPRHKGLWRGYNGVLPALAEDRCCNCDGRGCEACEPGGVIVRFNFNTLERIEETDG